MKYDVMIIGGGPAGSSAAIHCTQKNRSVCIIERENFPRYRPGETLHPGMEPLFKQLGVLREVDNSDFLRHDGTIVQWGERDELQCFSPYEDEQWFGYQAIREELDLILLEEAIHRGAVVCMPASIKEVEFSENDIVTATLDDGTSIEANYIIDATGQSQWLARQLKIKYIPYSPRFIVRFGYAQPTPSCALFDHPRIVADETGWTWIAPIKKDLYQWTRLNTNDEKISDQWFPSELPGYQAVGKSQGSDMTWRIAEQLAGPGFFLTGDAAAVLDPASSHGVLKAVMSGIRAADLINYVLSNKCSAQEAANGYQNWLNDMLQHDIKHLREMYQEIGLVCTTV